MAQKPRKPVHSSHHPIRHGPASRRRKHVPGPRHAPPAPVVAPPGPEDVWRWARTGMLDGFIFLLGAVISSIVQLRTGFQWLVLIGIVIAVVLTNIRKLPARPKPVKAGYFGGLAGLFAAGMLGMLFVMPRMAWPGVLLFSAAMAAISVAAIIIGLRSAIPTEPDKTDTTPD